MVQTTNFNNYSQVVKTFEFDAPYQKLETCVDLVEGTANEDKSTRFFNQLILPTAIITVIRLKCFFAGKKNAHLKTFEKSVRYNFPIVLVSAGAYFLWWSFAFELLLLLWGAFHQTISWEFFFSGVFQWQTVQVIILFFILRLISKIALDSFHINATFYARYDLLMKEAQTITEGKIIDLEVINNFKLEKIELLKHFIQQTTTAILANDNISPKTAQQLQSLLLDNQEKLISQFGLSVAPTIGIDSISDDDGLSNLDTSTSSDRNLFNDRYDEEYGNNY